MHSIGHQASDIWQRAPSSKAVVTRYAPSRWFLVAPVVLILATFGTFVAFKPLGTMTAYVMGIGVYWLAAGIILPLILVGRGAWARMFARPAVHLDWLLLVGLMLLVVPVVAGFLFVFPSLFPVESSTLLPLLAAYALLNGLSEDVFWRGVYVQRFGTNPWLGIVYPAVLFSAWQLVPWALFRGPLDVPAFVFSGTALALGLVHNWVAWRTKSIRWTAMAHVLMNLSGIGTLLVYWPGF